MKKHGNKYSLHFLVGKETYDYVKFYVKRYSTYESEICRVLFDIGLSFLKGNEETFKDNFKLRTNLKFETNEEKIKKLIEENPGIVDYLKTKQQMDKLSY
jgi:hypothetical protein